MIVQAVNQMAGRLGSNCFCWQICNYTFYSGRFTVLVETSAKYAIGTKANRAHTCTNSISTIWSVMCAEDGGQRSHHALTCSFAKKKPRAWEYVLQTTLVRFPDRCRRTLASRWRFGSCPAAAEVSLRHPKPPHRPLLKLSHHRNHLMLSRCHLSRARRHLPPPPKISHRRRLRPPSNTSRLPPFTSTDK